ncbi:Hypothetical protein D9617_22g066240 [Elsinoe fawcettii]|nr:Hypothetical protein D9617_22g066240 [Elsinoe fawcettii]
MAKVVKVLIAIIVSLTNFTANFSGAGLSVATYNFQMQFQKTPNQVNGLLTSFITLDKSVSFICACVNPYTFLLYPGVLWTIFIFGVTLACQITLTFALPGLLLAPPYLFQPSSIGLMQVGPLVGFPLACFGGYVSDIITTQIIRKSAGHYFPE